MGGYSTSLMPPTNVQKTRIRTGGGHTYTAGRLEQRRSDTARVRTVDRNRTASLPLDAISRVVPECLCMRCCQGVLDAPSERFCHVLKSFGRAASAGAGFFLGDVISGQKGRGAGKIRRSGKLNRMPRMLKRSMVATLHLGFGSCDDRRAAWTSS